MVGCWLVGLRAGHWLGLGVGQSLRIDQSLRAGHCPGLRVSQGLRAGHLRVGQSLRVGRHSQGRDAESPMLTASYEKTCSTEQQLQALSSFYTKEFQDTRVEWRQEKFLP